MTHQRHALMKSLRQSQSFAEHPSIVVVDRVQRDLVADVQRRFVFALNLQAQAHNRQVFESGTCGFVLGRRNG